MKTSIEFAGQPYLDRPVRVYPKGGALALSVAAAFVSGRVISYLKPRTAVERPIAVRVGLHERERKPLVVRFERVMLDWLQ